MPVALPFRMDLERPKRPIENVYFSSGIASVVAVHTARKTLEVGVVGCEGCQACRLSWEMTGPRIPALPLVRLFKRGGVDDVYPREG
jgi:hypothetical protein